MASITFVTPAELSEVVARLDMVEQRLAVHEEFADDEVRTKKALQLTGIKSRTTLIEERDRPGTLIRYSKHGRSTSYSRKSCIDYRLSRRLHRQSSLTLRIAS
jgi:predicted mannosyl-3-phosphoglycerate phosphatase (HAD superfamily)